MLDTTTGKLTVVCDQNVYGGFSNELMRFCVVAATRSGLPIRARCQPPARAYLYSVDTRQIDAGDRRDGRSPHPAFDRDGKYLYFIASTNAGATSDGLDMTSDLYSVTSNIYAAVLPADGSVAARAGTGRRKAGREKGRKEGREEGRQEGRRPRRRNRKKPTERLGDEKRMRSRRSRSR